MSFTLTSQIFTCGHRYKDILQPVIDFISVKQKVKNVYYTQHKMCIVHVKYKSGTRQSTICLTVTLSNLGKQTFKAPPKRVEDSWS